MKGGILQSPKRRLRAWLALRIGLLLLGVVGGAVLAAVLLDAALGLPELERRVIPWLLGGCALGVAGLGAWQWRRFEEQRLALLFERVEPALGNRLINAVQLSHHTGESPVEEVLRREAVELGRSAAAGVAVWPAVRAGVRAATGLAALAIMAWVCLVLVGGDLLRAVLPRFLDPLGDHPPYSSLSIEVTPGKTDVLYGSQVEVRAKVGRGAADKLWLVAQAGTNLTRTLMFLAPDKTFFQTLANLREPTQYFVTDGCARTHRFGIGIRYTPQLTMVEVTTTFPQYTGKPARTARLSDEPQALPEDTKVSFRVASNRPLNAGQLTLTPVLGGKVTQIRLQPEVQNNIVGGAFTLTQPVLFSLSVRDVNGLASVEPRQGRFNILPDERPRLFVLEPGRDAVATPSIRVPVRVEASDDYGITRVVWLRGLNRSIERPFNMKLVAKSGPQSVEASGSFDFDKLGVRPGDVIEYYFEAADNYPKGPNLALSRLYRVQIITAEQYAAILRQAAARKALFEPYFALDAWLRRLAERARNLQRQAESGSEQERQAAAKEAAELAADLAKYQKELGKLLEQATFFDVEQAFRNTLVTQHTGVGEVLKSLQGLGSGQFDPKELAAAAEKLTQLAHTESENVGQPAGQIAAVARLLARADTFVKLAQQQAALAELLRRFADKNGGLSRLEQMEMEELAYQQGRIQAGLRELLGSLPELLGNLPADPQYAVLRTDVNAFVQAVAEARIEEDLSQNGRNLSAQDGKSGYVLAHQAAEKMDKLIGKCRGNLQQDGKTCLRFKPSVQEALGNTLEQILAAMGAGAGNGQGGKDGYALFNDDVALYGPNVELAGEQAGGRGEKGQAAVSRAERVPGESRDPALKQVAAPGRVRLQPDAKFPLRYRDLVGEYFRVIAESEAATGGAK